MPDVSTKHVNLWTRKELNALPYRAKWDETLICNSLVILPLRKMHDSGYRCMDFVAVKKAIPFCCLSGCSDVLHIDGIGGYGKDYSPKLKIPVGWSIDCLQTSGLLQIWPSNKQIEIGPALSSFEIFAIR